MKKNLIALLFSVLTCLIFSGCGAKNFASTDRGEISPKEELVAVDIDAGIKRPRAEFYEFDLLAGEMSFKIAVALYYPTEINGEEEEFLGAALLLDFRKQGCMVYKIQAYEGDDGEIVFVAQPDADGEFIPFNGGSYKDFIIDVKSGFYDEGGLISQIAD